jgi:hypothetical protein
MKKIIVLMIMCFMFLTTNLVVAETVAETPILFRSNQWGATLPTVLKSFPSEVRFYDINADSSYVVEEMLLGEGSQYFDGHVCGYVSARSSSLDNMTVAGYEVTGILMRFAWVPDENHLIVEDNDHTALYYAEYTISPKDPAAVLADLKTKLSSIYGDVDATKSDGIIIKDDYSIWYGGDNTLIALVGRDYGSGSYKIEIRYGTIKGNEMLQTAFDALILQETLNVASDTDGL